MTPYLERYQRGEHRSVWNDLLQLAPVALRGLALADALAVAQETMMGVRHNLELLVSHLQRRGYPFRHPEAVLLLPQPNVEEQIQELERRAGVLPLSLRAFYQVVGSVDFTARNSPWVGCDYPDPLVVFPIQMALHELQEWEQDREEYEKAFGSFRIPIAPDLYHKEDVSGGMWYGIALPSLGADAILLEEWHETTFVEYLRICFHWAGFPGLERTPTASWQPLEELTAGLLKI